VLVYVWRRMMRPNGGGDSDGVDNESAIHRGQRRAGGINSACGRNAETSSRHVVHGQVRPGADGVDLCARHYSAQRTISAEGYRDHGSKVLCLVSTVEPSVKIGWDIDFGCQYSKARDDHGYASFLFYPMTGNRLGVVQVSP
jgi:hypothetical protein